ncbi:pyridoxamine 5'-phosphate oxidase [Gramella sp. GC03-9]|uniref:Pyridoxine/pyridoxamine 5'-phosphate oxidase n=1 Tax=Christiangramia oceanisediminis TaxID=2920386 RepID=A0A9X2KYL1_9FLAO|nr:pyridoxamine 5'-phosphate oxidase [Gramella oceanisediminis]MCP9200715.1 pyridoxamine 5'-phosphate oxidase [Gramella oceanisediminis]
MQKDLKHYRKSYEKGELTEADLPANPFILFQSWFDMADENDHIDEANAMHLSTVGVNGMPKTRVVLLKSYSRDGFIFFSNYHSEKGIQLDENPQCCLSFFWPALEKQVIIQGKVSKIAEAESTAYFKSRPKGSQLGAHASAQSSVIGSRAILENRLAKLEEEYKNLEIPKPTNWGGYIVKPINMEFWQGRRNRLHDRILYSKNNDNWKIERLAP